MGSLVGIVRHSPTAFSFACHCCLVKAQYSVSVDLLMQWQIHFVAVKVLYVICKNTNFPLVSLM